MRMTPLDAIETRRFMTVLQEAVPWGSTLKKQC